MYAYTNYSGLHQKTTEMHLCMRRHNKMWCTHVGQEILVLVYALLMCKLVMLALTSQYTEHLCFSEQNVIAQQ